MREIEIKIKPDLSLEELEVIFKREGFDFSDEKYQEDRIYTDPDTLKRFDEYTSDANFLRIRTEGNKATFNFKRSETSELDSIEHETEISNKDEMHKILNLLGYVEAVEVKKRRIQGSKVGLTICLDEVEGLGEFLEVEKITEDNVDGDEVRQELRSYLAGLGIQGEEVLRGYDTLVYMHKNKT